MIHDFSPNGHLARQAARIGRALGGHPDQPHCCSHNPPDRQPGSSCQVRAGPTGLHHGWAPCPAEVRKGNLSPPIWRSSDSAAISSSPARKDYISSAGWTILPMLPSHVGQGGPRVGQPRQALFVLAEHQSQSVVFAFVLRMAGASWGPRSTPLGLQLAYLLGGGSGRLLLSCWFYGLQFPKFQILLPF